eukprot:gb/GECG01011832.1/.p1 GENE.gb/GECG01011832.1/~~gb/GECG01011832.1/.p1  ORF type:complete len:450 (+),score=49.28 gb/GECG01011832.1/:1-1350(+)
MRTFQASTVLMGAMTLMASMASATVELRENDVTGLCGSTNSFSGYADISEETNKHYFYWFFASRSNPSSDPLILWMTGGPGCSSELAVLKENGPCKVTDDGSDTKENPYGWNAQANIVYIDQPAGTGFSYSDKSGYDHNETQVAEDMYKFFQAFYDKHPSLLKNDLFIIGESYGGHYVPATSHRVYEGNKRGEGHHIRLTGVAVGNGLTNPLVQYQYYPQLAYNYSISKIGQPIVSESTYNSMVSSWPQCRKMIANCQTDTDECPKAQSYCGKVMVNPYEETGRNPYDIRKMCNYRPLCYDMSSVTTFLTNKTVTDMLGVTGHKWSVCNFQVNGDFTKDWMKQYQQDVVPLLENNIPVLIYAGDVDFICNWLGNKAWALDLKWSGKQAFNEAADNAWNVKGQQAGEVRTANGFTFLRVFNAGHMVPQDQPQAALAMLKTFLNQSPWNQE